MDALKVISIKQGELSKQNYYYLKKALDYKNQYLSNKHCDPFLTVDSLIHLNNIITNSNNFGLRNVNVKLTGYCKVYMYKNDVEIALYTLANNFNDQLIIKKDFCETFLNQINPFQDRNGGTCKELFI